MHGLVFHFAKTYPVTYWLILASALIAFAWFIEWKYNTQDDMALSDE